MDLWNLVIGVVGAVLALAGVLFAFLAWRAAKPAAQWEVERLDVGQYKITRTGLLPARILVWGVPHEGPPIGVSHASGEVEPILFARGRSVHFRYLLPHMDGLVVTHRTPLEMRGRELLVQWVHSSLRRKPDKGRFRDWGKPQVISLMLD